MRLQTPKPLHEFFSNSNTLSVLAYLINSDNQDVLRFSEADFIKENSSKYKLVATSRGNSEVIKDIKGVRIQIESDNIFIYYDYIDTVYKYEDYTLNATIIYNIYTQDFTLGHSDYNIEITSDYAKPGYFVPIIPNYMTKNYVNLDSGYSAPLMSLKVDHPIRILDYFVLNDKYPILTYATASSSPAPLAEEFSYSQKDLLSDVVVSDLTQSLGNFFCNLTGVDFMRVTDEFTEKLVKSKFDSNKSRLDLKNFIIKRSFGESKFVYIEDFLSQYKSGKYTILDLINKFFESYIENAVTSDSFQVTPNYEIGDLIINIQWYFKTVQTRPGRLNRYSIYEYFIYNKSTEELINYSSDTLRFLIGYDYDKILVGDRIYNLGSSNYSYYDDTQDFEIELFGNKCKLVNEGKLLINGNLS